MSYVERIDVPFAKRGTPPSLRTSLHEALSGASWQGLALVDTMLVEEGTIGSAGCVARRLGLRNRFEVARLLTGQGLPPLHELAGWVSVLVWVNLCAPTGMSLCAFALRRGRDPAACYRLVQRVTGHGWSAVRALGVQWVLAQLVARCSAVRDGRGFVGDPAWPTSGGPSSTVLGRQGSVGDFAPFRLQG